MNDETATAHGAVKGILFLSAIILAFELALAAAFTNMAWADDKADLAAASTETTIANTSTTAPTRQEIIDSCSVSMTPPTTEGEGAWKFKLTDTSAQVNVALHESVPFARLTVYAYPKAATFDPDNVSYNKQLFSIIVRDGDTVDTSQVTAEFGDKLAALDTTYNVIAYLYFQVPSASGDDYQGKASQGFTVVDASGQTTENYTYPKAGIVETALPTGATAMHVILTGDERLFALAQQTANNPLNSRFVIHFLVVEYDASITYFDLGEDTYTKLYDEEATEAFTNKEIDLEAPLTAGKKVRALCYWTQYSGEGAAIPVPRGVDYDGKDEEAIVVTDDAAPIATTPQAVVDAGITTATRTFNVTAKNLPADALMFVDAFGPNDAIEHSYSNALKMFTGFGENPAPVNGANAVAVEAGRLSEGDRIVAFIMVKGEVVAQSKPVTVTSAAQSGGNIAIATSPITANTSKVTVHIESDIADGTAVLLKSFAQGTEIATDKGTPHGYFASVAKGDNELTLTNVDGLATDGVLVAFLMNAGSVLGQSEPVAIQRQAAAPTATIGLDGNDVALTQGDKFISLTWSVDPQAKSASYTLYQFTGDTLDKESATVIAQGSLTTSAWNHSGTTWVGLGGKLEANAHLQLAITADDQETLSNVMTVGETPSWAKARPAVSFGQSAVRAGDKTVKLTVSYPEEYKSLGKEFFCNVVVYQYPGDYTDEDFEDGELDEHPEIAKVVAGLNSANGETNGEIELTFSENAQLVAGNRLIAKIRLPQPERQDHDSMWEDYLSWSIPVVAADASIPGEMVMAYNLGPDSAKGEALARVCDSLGLQFVQLSQADLTKQVGAIVGFDGYDQTFEQYANSNPTVEYLLLANLSEASLDRLLAAMDEAGIEVGAKGITTETNKKWPLGRLIVDIAEEHEVMTALIDLQYLVRDAEELDEATYGTAEKWAEMKAAIASARALYDYDPEDPNAEEPTADKLHAAYDELEPLYLAVKGIAKLDGTVVVTAEKQSDGTYTLHATVEGASNPNLAYEFAWDDAAGTAGQDLAGVAAERVGARTVYVRADGVHGELTGRLQAPQKPANLIVSANPGRVDVSWDEASSQVNTPSADTYVVELHRDGALVDTASSASPRASFANLAAGTYTVKAYAVNVAGRSDKAIETVAVEAALQPEPSIDVNDPGAGTEQGSDIGDQPAKTKKSPNTMKVVSKAKTKKTALAASAKALAKKDRTISIKRAFSVTKAKGKVTYRKVKGSKKIIVSKDGKVTLKKGLKPGLYTVKVNVTAAGNTRYLSKTAKSLTFLVRVK